MGLPNHCAIRQALHYSDRAERMSSCDRSRKKSERTFALCRGSYSNTVFRCCANTHRRMLRFALITLAISLFLPSPLRPAGITIEKNANANVFLSSESVGFAVETAADHVSWSVTDFWSGAVSSGSNAVVLGNASITPALAGKTGYFLLSVNAVAGGSTVASAETAFAVLAPLTAPPDSPFGVNTHYAQGWDQSTIALITRLGVNSARDECYWSVEQASPDPPGAFVFGPPFDTYLHAFQTNAIDPLMELNGGGVSGNPNYDQGLTPHTSAGFNGFANYCCQVLDHYGSQIQNVEIWNEFNGTWCTGPAASDRAPTYAQLLQTAFNAIKATHPSVNVIGGSTAGVPLPYLEHLFQAGGLASMDAVSVHPYRYNSPPEGIETDIGNLDTLIRRYHGGIAKPIWATEIGWYTNTNPWPGQLTITEADQAKFLVRANALLLSAGATHAYWYYLRDDGRDPPMGLLRSDDDPLGAGCPKPAYAAMAAMVRQLSGAVYTGTESTLDGVYSMLFSSNGQSLRMIWSVNPGTTTFTVNAANSLSVTDLMGNETILPASAGRVQLALTDAPIYVVGPIQSLPPPDVTVLADGAKDFSGTQGQANWYYGYFASGATPGPYSTSGFTQMATYTCDDWNYQWCGPAAWLNIMSQQMEPSAANGLQLWAVRRWVSTVAGPVRIKGRFDSTSNQGDGVHAQIFVDGVPVFSQQLSAGTVLGAAFDLQLTVRNGSLVDFAVDPGPSTNNNYDATAFNARITQAVPPSTAPTSSSTVSSSSSGTPATATPTAGSGGGGAINEFSEAALLILVGLRCLLRHPDALQKKNRAPQLGACQNQDGPTQEKS
jgi:hypothetical protein